MATPLQKDALTNEFKGVVFEFMVAQLLAKHFGILSIFVHSISEAHYRRLQGYEDHLRRFLPDWYLSLPVLAKKTCDKLLQDISTLNCTRITLAGKSHSEEKGEGDIVLEGPNDYLLISLKLGKWSSFVNTKSAGIKSFIEEYFSFGHAKELQKELNNKIDFYYNQMAHDLYQSQALDYDGSFNVWIENGYSELPGELTEEQHYFVSKYYHQLCHCLYELFVDMIKHYPSEFKRSLLPLLGFGNDKIIQAICFHQQTDFKFVHVISYKKIYQSLNDLTLQEKYPEVGYFDLKCEDFILQIRIKPMNKFTAKSVKINCSVKYKI